MLFLSLSGCDIFNSVLGLQPHSCHELLRAALGFGWVAPIFFALSTDVLKYAVQFFGVLDSVCALSLCRFFRYIFGWLRGQGSHCGYRRVPKMIPGLWPHPTLHPTRQRYPSNHPFLRQHRALPGLSDGHGSAFALRALYKLSVLVSVHAEIPSACCSL